jgi:hypothetical protein
LFGKDREADHADSFTLAWIGKKLDEFPQKMHDDFQVGFVPVAGTIDRPKAQPFAQPFPERVRCVKGLLAGFLTYVRRKSPRWAFSPLLLIFSRIANFASMSLTVCLFEIVEPFFSCAAAPP